MKFPEPLLTGSPIDGAPAAILMIHGRGASAEDMVGLFEALGIPQLAAVAAQAPGNTWYPNSFLAPLSANQPHLDRSLAQIESLVSHVISHGIPAEKLALLGFSQGACLTCEFVARNPQRYGAVIALTGGLIGPPGTPRNYPGSLTSTPIFLGTSDPDPHVPFARVQETRDVFAALGAKVELRRYLNMGHTINHDELDACRKLLSALIS